MKYKKLLFTLSIIPLILLTSCDFLSSQNELEVKFNESDLEFAIDQEFDYSIFTVSNKNTNELIYDFDIYLDNTFIKDGEILKEKGTFDLTIKVEGYKDYVLNNSLYVFNNELKVDTSNIRLTYKVGEAITFNGLKVYDKFNNEVKDYNLDYKEGHIFTNKGRYQVVISKKDYISATFYLTIEERLEIKLDTINIKKIYTIGEEFSLNNLIVKDNLGNEIVDYTSSIKEGTILNEEGKFVVTITYLDYLPASFEIEVTSLKLMEIKTYPKQDYIIGENFDFSDIEIIDSTSNEEITDYIFKLNGNLIDSSYVFKSLGEFEIIVESNGYLSVGYIVTVNNSGLYVDSLPNKVDYLVGESFSLEGLKVTDHFNIINDYQVSLNEGYIFKHKGEVEIKITKEGFNSTSFKINVLNKKGLFIKAKPTKVYYELGDTFDPSGLIIQDNNTYQEIKDYSLSLNSGVALNTLGVINVEVKKENYPVTSFEIEVLPKFEVNEVREFKIYTLNDTHGAFIRDSENNEAGMAYIGKYFKERKDENTLILSMGDMFQGGLESNDTHGNIMVDAMNLIGFDAMALGNHEFDWGEEILKNNADLASFPFLSSNAFKADTNQLLDFILPSYTFNLANLKVGVIGSAREDMGSSILGSISKNYVFPNPISYIKDESDKLRDLGCDLVILASHDEGFEGYSGEPTEFNSLTTISNISNERYVDSMLFAHDHLRKSGVYNDVSFLEAGGNGEYFGEVTINVKKVNDNEYQIVNNTSRYVNAYTTCKEEDQEISNLVNKYDDLIRNRDSVIYTFKSSYSREEFGEIVCQAIFWFMNKYNYIFDNRNIYLTTHNTAGIRNEVNSGPFTYADLVKACPFDNCLALQKCTTSEMKYLKNNRALINYQNPNGKIDDDGYYYCGTISYVAEWTDYSGDSITTDYTLYPEYIIGDVVYEFLINNHGLNL